MSASLSVIERKSEVSAEAANSALALDVRRNSGGRVWSLTCCGNSLTERALELYRGIVPRCPMCNQDKPKLVQDVMLERTFACVQNYIDAIHAREKALRNENLSLRAKKKALRNENLSIVDEFVRAQNATKSARLDCFVLIDELEGVRRESITLGQENEALRRHYKLGEGSRSILIQQNEENEQLRNQNNAFSNRIRQLEAENESLSRVTQLALTQMEVMQAKITLLEDQNKNLKAENQQCTARITELVAGNQLLATRNQGLKMGTGHYKTKINSV